MGGRLLLIGPILTIGLTIFRHGDHLRSECSFNTCSVCTVFNADVRATDTQSYPKLVGKNTPATAYVYQ